MKGLILLANHFEDVEAICTIDMLRRAKITIDLVSVTNEKQLITQSNICLFAEKVIEEVEEVVNTFMTGFFYWDSKYNSEPPRLLAINLIGHGCILIARDVEILKELQNYKDSCFVARPMPEVVKNEDV